MELGDYDGDGETDIFLSGYSGFIVVMTGNGDGTFNASRTVFGGQLFGATPTFAVGDLDLDGRSDVALPDPYGQRLLVLRSPRPVAPYAIDAAVPLSITPVAARIADLNGDGIPDIAVLGDTGAIQTLLGR